ncbi:MAG: acetylornithine transaminase [Candidatus Nanopelagicales bacterium]|nr:acetylornithine transaminase [Candidatus Nanopelagicales bacterium]
MTKTSQGQKRWDATFMPNYGTPNMLLDHGKGATVWDADGKKYIDFLAGIAVNILGHAHPALTEAVTKQMSTLGHTSNFAMHEPGLALAERLLEITGRPGKVFLCNSGTEANEAAIKLSRLTGKSHIVSLHGSFHGRSVGALSLTGQPKKSKPFAPLMPDVSFIAPNDISDLESGINDKTAALWIEPIMGEGGVLPLTSEYLNAARSVTTKHNAMFVVDEVQTGIARTGSWFAYQNVGVDPDVLLLAKGLGGGFPIGAMIAFGEYQDLMTQGMHGTTYGGNAVACAAALAVLETVEREDLMSRAKYIESEFVAHISSAPGVDHVRGAGAMLGVVLTHENAAVVETKARELGLIINAPAANVLRIVPPLVITDSELREGVALLTQALRECEDL